jgi:phosphoribosylamine--glycine ligase
MKVLVIGGGAREHAIVWKIKQSQRVSKIYVAPGNAGTSEIAENVDIKDNDIDGLVKFAKENNVELTVVGPEVPLCLGVVDTFEKENLRVFGPNQKAAELEGSKVFCKDFFKNHNIPTAQYESYSKIEDAKAGLKKFNYPLVIKADGLAAGKGVVICQTEEEAQTCLKDMMEDAKFGTAGNNIVIEEFLTGTEASLLCFVDGKTLVPMESAKDYKKAYDNDEGLNTGGMGTFSPNHLYTEELNKKIEDRILIPTMEGFKKDGIEFKGVLFIGLMIEGDDIKVLEFNVRFGDPETEVVLPRLESDLVDVFEQCIDGTLTAESLKWTNKQSCCVIIASGGYPESYEKGKVITGLKDVDKDITVFHAGTSTKNGEVVTTGGRVLAVTCLADSVEEARNKVYANIDKIKFDKSFYRTDIGKL